MALTIPSFVFGGDTGLSADDLKRQREVAKALLARGIGAPRNVGEGLSALGNAIAFRIAKNKLEKGETARETESQGIFDDLIGGGSSSSMPTPGAAGEIAATAPGTGTGGGDMQAYRDAIASIESAGSGDYQAVGPTHSKLGRALGRYQVMEANIGPWSQEALGKAISSDEFLANPELQDRIFDHKFKGYVDQFGPEGAAQAWFAGPGGVGKGDRKDSLGTSVSAYADKFSRALGGAGGDQVASLDPAAGMAEGAIVPGAEPIVPMEGQGMPDTAVDGGQNPAVAAIDAQTTALPVPGQAEQTDGIMQAVNGTNTGGTFGLNPMQQEVAQAVINRGGPTLEKLLRAAADPRLTDEHRKVVGALLEREMAKEQAAADEQRWRARQDYERQATEGDPLRKLQLRKAQAEVDALGQGELKVVGKRLVRAMPDGSIIDVTPATGGANASPFRFEGSSVEAQALNGLMDSGQLTPEQAQQLGAGKTITGPNGEIIFMTPQGVFGSTVDGQTQRLSGDMPDAGAIDKGSRGGNITLTEPKVTIDERKAMGFADRMGESGRLLNEFENAGLGTWDQFVRGNDWIPDVAENWMVSDDFQQFDQARRDFINAQMRRESGAVISPEEFDNANKQYLPQPGDTPEVVKQKRANRQTVIDSMARDAGPTYGSEIANPLADARKAIAAGANREAVIQRLRENGINPEGL